MEWVGQNGRGAPTARHIGIVSSTTTTQYLRVPAKGASALRDGLDAGIVRTTDGRVE